MTTTDKPKSYTTRLIEFLEEHKTNKKTIDLIKEFALEETERKKEQQEATKGIMTWGKFKGKRIEDVFKLDPQYIKWCIKNSQYLNEHQKELMNELLSQ